MSTQIYYNGVAIFRANTTFRQEAVYDQTNTDLLYHRFRVTATGYVHSSGYEPEKVTTSENLPADSGGTRTVLNQIELRRKLLEPRKEFEMRVGDDPIIIGKPFGAGGPIHFYDVNNGPKPIRCDVTLIAGTQLIRVVFEIEVCTVDCGDRTGVPVILNNRFQMGDDYDEDWYCTRTTRGVLRLATSNLTSPHAFRGWVFPPLPRGFQRKSVSVNASLDGLALEYVITDQSKYAAPPRPATSWQATHTVMTGDGVTTHAEISVVMRGPPVGAPKRELIEACVLIGEAKLRTQDLGTERSSSVLEAASIIDHMHDNTVEYRARILVVPPKEKPLSLYEMDTLKIGLPLSSDDIPQYDRFSWPIPPTFPGLGAAEILLCQLQSSCQPTLRLVETEKETEDQEDGESGDVEPPDTSITVGPIYENDNYSEEHRENAYTFYEIDARYAYNHHKVQLPKARATTQQPSTPTCSIVYLGRNVVQKTIKVEAERIGAWPSMPEPKEIRDDGGTTAELLWHEVVAAAPRLMADGRTKLYSVTATYRYALLKPPADDLATGSLPWDSTTLGENVLPASSFLDNEIA